jgi:transposase
VEIARRLEVHANTIYADLHAFDIFGVTAVYHLGQGGAPQLITPAQLAEVWRLAE